MIAARHLVIGADTPTGAYLVRLLAARGASIATVGEHAILDRLGGSETVSPASPEALAEPARAFASVFLIDAPAHDAAADALIAALSAEEGSTRLVNVVDRSALAVRAPARRRIAALVAHRARHGAPVATALLHAHESRIGAGDGLLLQIIDHLWRAANGKTGEMLELVDSGASDWGWTAEYVDAVSRLAQRDTLVDIDVATGRKIALAEIVAHAARYFSLDPAAHVRISPGTAAIEAEVDVARLKAVTGWSASTWGKDLVETLCEGAASRHDR